MSRGITVAVLALVPSLMGCNLIMGESFTDQDLYNPKTGEKALCAAHNGRGSPSQAEIDTMNACVARYTERGFVKAGTK